MLLQVQIQAVQTVALAVQVHLGMVQLLLEAAEDVVQVMACLLVLVVAAAVEQVQ